MTSDPEQIRDSIEQTRQNLTADVDALTEKVSPPRIVDRRVRQTRSAITNVRDRIMGSASETTSAVGTTAASSAASAKDTVASARDTVAAKASSAADAASSVPEQARQRTRGNPLAAGLIAFGAGWLLSSLLPAAEAEQQIAAQVKEVAVEKSGPLTDQVSQAAQELRESAQQRAQSVKETAADAASAVTGEARSQAADVSDHAQQAGGRVTDQVSPGGS